VTVRPFVVTVLEGGTVTTLVLGATTTCTSLVTVVTVVTDVRETPYTPRGPRLAGSCSPGSSFGGRLVGLAATLGYWRGRLGRSRSSGTRLWRTERDRRGKRVRPL
jgi:hypothetical protein